MAQPIPRSFELVQEYSDFVRARLRARGGVSEAKVAASMAHLEELLTVSLEQPMRIELELAEHLTPPVG